MIQFALKVLRMCSSNSPDTILQKIQLFIPEKLYQKQSVTFV